MKKLVSIILCIGIILSALPSFSAEKESGNLEKILAEIKTRIPDTDGFENFDSNSYTENSITAYSFTWYTDGDKYKNMNVSVLSNGIITGLGIYSYDETSENPGFDRITTEEAMEKTYGLLYNLNPSLSGKLRLETYTDSESFSSQGFNFTVKHIENEIAVKGDTGYVSVDINAEKIQNFSINYTPDLTYENPAEAISAEDAKKAFTEKIGFVPSYRVYNDYKEKRVKIFPVYEIENSNLYINAINGEPEEILTSVIYRNTAFSEEKAMLADAAGAPFTAAEMEEISNYENLISEKEAEEILRKNSYFKITSDYKSEKVTLNKRLSFGEEYVYSFSFNKEDDKKYSYISASVDATSGEILSYHNSDSTYSEKAFDRAKYEKKAEEIISALAPVKKAEYTEDENTSSDNPSFNYTRYVNGIKVNGDYITVEFDKETGKLKDYRINYTNGSFLDISAMLKNEDICGKLFELTEYNLIYIPETTDEKTKIPVSAGLYYSFDNDSFIFNALSGERIDYRGELYKEELKLEDYTDISSHYAAEKINALKRFGIGFEGGLFKPDENILQKDFVYLLYASLYGGGVMPLNTKEQLEDFYESFIRRGIIKKEEVAPENSVTRQFAGKLIIRLLEMEKIALLEHIYNCPFEDVYEEKGYSTLLWGLGIINGTSEKTFTPSGELTRAQAAILVYNTMEKRN